MATRSTRRRPKKSPYRKCNRCLLWFDKKDIWSFSGSCKPCAEAHNAEVDAQRAAAQA